MPPVWSRSRSSERACRATETHVSRALGWLVQHQDPCDRHVVGVVAQQAARPHNRHRQVHERRGDGVRGPRTCRYQIAADSMPMTMRQFLRVASVSLAIVSVSSPVVSQSAPPADPRLYAGLAWRNVGPFRGGRISAVSGVIGRPARSTRAARRRRVEDHQRRRNLVPGLRRRQGRVVDRRGRSGAVRPERRSTSAPAT